MFSRSLCGAVLAIGALLTWSCAPAQTGEAAAATATPRLELEAQPAWIEPSTSNSPTDFTLSLAITAPQGSTITATLGDRLTSRTAFTESLSTPPQGSLDHTAALPVSSLPMADQKGVPEGTRTLTIAVVSTGTAPGTSTAAPRFDLACTGNGGQCAGVYPVTLTLDQAGGGTASSTQTSLAHLTTYLTYVEGTSSDPLAVATVLPIATVPSFAGGAPPTSPAPSPASALNALSTTTTDVLLADAHTLEATQKVPLTIEPSPMTMGLLDTTSQGRQAIGLLAAGAGTSTLRQILPTTYVGVNVGQLKADELPPLFDHEITRGLSVDHRLGLIPKTTTLAEVTWIAQGPLTPELGPGLTDLGARHVVVPGTTLAIPTTPSTGTSPTGTVRGAGAGAITWSSAFELGLATHAPIAAAEADADLTKDFTIDPSDPARCAESLLGDLSMIHFEAPNATSTRGVVAMPPPGWVPTATFLSTLLGGLDANPILSASTLTQFFADFPHSLPSLSPTGGTTPKASTAPPTASVTSAPTTAHPAPSTTSPPPQPTTPLALTTRSASVRLTAFESALTGHPPVGVQLDDAMLATQSDLLTPTSATAALADFEDVLQGQLSQFKVATERTVTLTARKGTVPITVTAAAPYGIRATLALSSDRFKFPKGATLPLNLNHPTTSVQIQVEALSPGDLPLNVELVTPKGNLVIDHATLTVRSTAISAVAIVLTALAGVVLLTWWARTWRASRKKKGAHSRRPAHR